MNRKYYLVFLSLVSKEETEDYVRLFDTFESAAAVISYQTSTILMCYFPLKKNVRDRLKGNKKKGIPPTPEQFKDMVLADITQLHYSRSHQELEFRLIDAWSKWTKIPELRNFQDYFWTQWIMNTRTNKW